ncbi:GNAT family N-acetyltransferase [Psychromonas aquatilis]|uniref:GNAT family N-acetyltransferase n=1 Tax=Psychromonas aquatilis TaxID=2005072 RepID=A0ABU9GNR4_9GAMM
MQKWEIKFFSELSALRLYQILKLRQDVFVLEQTCLYPDLDNLDQQSVHLMLVDQEDDLVVGYCRILAAGVVYPEVAIGRVVVSELARKQGLARKLMLKAMDFIKQEMQVDAITISAQVHLQSFYQSLGFKPVSAPYDEDGIEHIKMTAAL